MAAADHPETMVGLLADRARRYPERTLIAAARAGGIERVSYADSARRVLAIAEWLAGHGLGKGDRVGCYIDAGEADLWFYFACAAIGAVPVPLSPSFSPEAFVQLAAQARVKAAFTEPSLAARIAAAGCPVLVFAADGEAPPAPATAIRPMLTDGPAALAALDRMAAAVAPGDLYMFQSTSGSTGVPKLVMRRNLTFPRTGRVLACGNDPEAGGDAGVLAFSLTHGAGHYFVATVLYLGGVLCLPSAHDTATPLDEVERLEPTFLDLVPRILRSLVEQHRRRYGEAAERTPFCGPRMRRLIIGSAPSDEALLSWLERRGVEVIEGYGASELSVVTLTEPGTRRPDTVGQVLGDNDVRIAPDGEIVVKTPYAMVGYFEAPELTAAAFDADGYYHTGDLGEIDADRYLHLRGRKRDLFNSSEGTNIYPARIEEMIEGLPWVGQAFLVGDALPFITALIVPRDAPGGAGVLDPEREAERYARARAGLAELNARLEGFERVRRFLLLAGPFDEAVYKTVGASKIRRDRKKLAERHAAEVARLYQADGDPRITVDVKPAGSG